MSTFAARADMPPGLERVVFEELERCKGEENGIRRAELLNCAKRQPGFKEVSDRQVRAAIEELRNQGILVGNLSDGGGYYLVVDMMEYQAFRAIYASRAITVMKTAAKMDEAAEKQFGRMVGAVQPGLFR